MEEQSNVEVCVLKVGGSVLTEKREERKARKDEIRRISKEISSSGRKNLILVHGAGSYGHPQAKKYLESRKEMDALFTHQSAKELNSMVISSLMEFGVSAMPIHPLNCVWVKGEKIEYKIKEQIEIAFTHGLIPVLHGDIILDKEEGFRILSGDQLVVYTAKEFKARKVGIAVDVDGVLTGEGKTIRKITPKDLGTMKIGSSKWIDVTGGMKEKVHLLAKLAAEDNIPSILFNGAKKSNIYKFLIDDKNLLGTVISL